MRTTKHRVIRTGVIAIVAGMAATVLTPAIASNAAPAVGYSFRKLDNPHDSSFNQLFGINKNGRIVGFYGSGAPGHPSRGYQVASPYHAGNYHPENYPGAAETEVTGLNDKGVSVGIAGQSAHFGFYLQGGRYHKVTFPTTNNSSPAFNELLGVNSSGIAVGDFQDSSLNMHPYRYNTVTHRFTRFSVRGFSDVVATSINDNGTIVGFFTNGSGQLVAFVRYSNGSVTTFAKSGAVFTQAFGINDSGEVVGTYTMGNGTFGFTWQAGHFTHTKISDPSGVGSTNVEGVNNAGDLVGWYTDSSGNTNGMLAAP
jgi:probable HAF family extracellular repeat protein